MRNSRKLRIVEVVVIIAALIPFGIIMVSNHIKARNLSFRNMCINNLRMIDSTKQQWALEQQKKGTDTPTMKDLWFYDYLSPPRDRRGWMEAPSCPADPANSFRTSYRIGKVSEPPTCLIDPKNHVLP
jgi:hypothetical protein